MISKKRDLVPFDGYCMFPTLRPGDLLELDKKAPMEPGGIYCFEKGGYVFAHRMHGLENGKARFSGDLFGPKEIIEKNAIRGKVVRIYRGYRILPAPARPKFYGLYRLVYYLTAKVRGVLAFTPGLHPR